jgi:hypothetical protein
MDKMGLSKLLLSLASDNPDIVEQSPDVASPTPSCLPLSRVRTAILRESWTEQESRHMANCTYCRQSEQQARSLVWHPSLVHLFWHARQLFSEIDIDLKHHLQRDACRRCLRLSAILGVDRLLVRLATQIRQGIANAANHLGRTLDSGAVASVDFVGSDLRLSFEDGKHNVLLSHADPARLCLEAPAVAGGTPQLLRVLIGDQQTAWDQLVVPRPAPDPSKCVADVRLPAVPSGRVALAVYPVETSLLACEDAELLRAAFVAACKLDPLSGAAWQMWAAKSLQRCDFDAALRPTLAWVSRPDGAKR